MHAPVETPLNRASVSTATCLPKSQILERRGDLVGLLHARAHRPAADQHEHVAGLDPSGPALDRRDRRRLASVNTARRAGLAVDAVRIDDGRIDRRALDDRAFGRQVAARERDRATSARAPRARPGDMITSSGSTPSRSRSSSRKRARGAPTPPTSPACSPSVAPLDRQHRRRRAGRARRRCSITSGTPPARNTCTVGCAAGRSAAHRPAAAPAG